MSLIPLVVCNRLNLEDTQPTRMFLQLADRSVKYLIGILEYILVRIGQLYIPTNFVVMDIKEGDEIPILLDRPFLSTVGAIIDIKRGKMNFEVRDQKVEFILYKFLMAPAIDDSCCATDIIDECIRELDQDQEMLTKMIKLPLTPIMGDGSFKSMTPFLDGNLHGCLALTPDHMLDHKEPLINLKELL